MNELKLGKNSWEKTYYTSNWPRGQKVKTLYVEEASEIFKEFYLSCLIDRETSKEAKTL